MEPVSQLLTLPFATLVVLAIGYIGYRIAYIGHDGPHGSADIVFNSLIFAAIGKAVMLFSPDRPYPMALLATAVVLGTAVFWRAVGSPAVFKTLREAGVSDHDRGRTVWESMLSRQDLRRPTQVRVRLRDGRELMCDDLYRFTDKPLGPCLLGPDGSVALYVTSFRSPGAPGRRSLLPTWTMPIKASR